MNRSLSFLIAGFFFAFSVFSQNKITVAKSSPELKGRSKNFSNSKNIIPQSVNSTTLPSCMSVNLPAPSTWSLVNYGVGTPFAVNGFVNGQNMYADREKAMYFDVSASANTMITQVYVGFGIAYSAVPSKTVAIRVYNGTGGTVGAALGQGTLSMGTIMNDVNNNQYSLVMFPTPINLPASKQFYVSVDVSGLSWPASGAKDSLSVISNSNTQTPGSMAREKQSNNLWYLISTSWNLNISLLIHPFLTQAPISAMISNSSNTICSGSSISYSSTGSTAGTYEWDFGAIPTPTAAGANATANYPASGTYTTYLIVEDACGSFGVSSKTVLVNATPTIASSPSSTSVCNGSPVTLTGSGAPALSWSGGISNGVAFTPSGSANYTLTGTAANGCTATAVSSVIVNTIPTVIANTSTNTVCDGLPVTLSGSGASSYTWTGGVSNGVAFVPAGPATYTVTGASVNNCTATATVSVNVIPTPTVGAVASSTSVCAGSTITLNGTGANSYVWSGGVNNGIAFAPSNGQYTVTGTAANGCTDTHVVSILVSPCTGIEKHTNDFNIRLAPNPSNGEFTISSVTGSIAEFNITDATGREVYQQKLNKHETKIILSLQSGMYFVNVLSENGKREKHKIIIQ